MLTQVGDVYLTLSNRIGQQLKVIPDFASAEWAKTVNQVGAMTAILPISYRQYIKIGYQLTIIRRPYGGAKYQEFEAVWFICKYEIYSDKNGTWIKVTALCQNFILRDRGVAYYATSTNASMSGLAGNLMKQVARDNLASTANDYSTVANASIGSLPARGIPTAYFGVDANTGDGASIEIAFSWRKVLDVLSDMAQLSNQGGSYLAFDLVSDAAGHFQFRTFPGQRGRDRRWKSSGLLAPVIIDPLIGNLSEGASIVYDAMEQATFVYAAGQGQETARLVGFDYALDEILSGPFMRREKVVDARNVKTQAAVDQVASMGLQDNQLKISFQGAITDAPGSIYGTHYRWGDRVTCQFEGNLVDCYLDYVRVSLTGRGGDKQGIEQKEISLVNS